MERFDFELSLDDINKYVVVYSLMEGSKYKYVGYSDSIITIGAIPIFRKSNHRELRGITLKIAYFNDIEVAKEVRKDLIEKYNPEWNRLRAKLIAQNKNRVVDKAYKPVNHIDAPNPELGNKFDLNFGRHLMSKTTTKKEIRKKDSFIQDLISGLTEE